MKISAKLLYFYHITNYFFGKLFFIFSSKVFRFRQVLALFFFSSNPFFDNGQTCEQPVTNCSEVRKVQESLFNSNNYSYLCKW